MNKTALALSILVFYILAASVPVPAHAIYLDAGINTKEQSTEPNFRFEKSIFVKYPEGGKIADLLRDKDTRVQFSANSMTPGVSDLITKLNENLKKLQSNAVVTDLKVEYSVYLEQEPTSTVINYKISLIPTITNYILREGSSDVTTLIDSRWRGISVDGPVIIHDQNLGDIDINSPIGFFKVALPDVYAEISETPAEQFLNAQIIDAKPILAQPLTNWLHLFDPLGILAETERFGYHGEKIPVTTFSMGESSFREGQQHEQIETVEFTKDKKYTMDSVQYQSIGVIRINGIVRTNTENGIEYFGATDKVVQGYGAYSSGNFPVTIIYAMAGMSVVGAVGFFYWSNKKANRESEYIQTGIDPKYLRGVTTSEAAGGYHTNRGEAELIGDSGYDTHQNVYGTNRAVTDNSESLPEYESMSSKTRGAMPKGWKPEN